MKKIYTRKQLTEAIAYWKKQLKKMNESTESDYMIRINDQSYDLIDPESGIEWGFAAESPYVQIYVNADDSVECVVYMDDAAEKSYSYIVKGLSGTEVRKNNLHRSWMNVVRKPE